jgi:predicted  nucleic acid-binding Zn-ribbon protein
MEMEHNLDVRLSSLERWRTTIEVSLGKLEVDKGYINKRFDAIEGELKEIKNAGKKLNYMVYASVVAYIVKFIVDGGLGTHLPII